MSAEQNPDTSRSAVEARTKLFCDLAGIAVPKLTFRRGKLVWDEALSAFLHNEGASMDWLYSGDAKQLILSYRKSSQSSARFGETLRELDEVEQQTMLFVLRLMLDQNVKADAAIIMWRDIVAERRKEQSAA